MHHPRFRALAADYDGTLAEKGRMAPNTVKALAALRSAGWRLILVTGRRLERIRTICDALDLFDEAILENGAAAFCPSTGEETALAPPLDAALVAEIGRVTPETSLFGGASMLGTETEYADRVAEVIGRGGYDAHIIRCGPRITVLPNGIDKGSGLAHALDLLGLSGDEVMAVGDEENDIPLFAGCGFKVAVANAVPELKAAADLVLSDPGGQGVQWLAAELLSGRLLPSA